MRKILEKYVTDYKAEDVLERYLNIPAYVLPEGFNAAHDSLIFKWEVEDSIYENVKKRVYTKEFLAKIKRCDLLYDFCGLALLLCHLFLGFYALPFEIFPPVLLVVCFWITRTGLASLGHYHSHRKKDGITDWADVLFDI